MGWQKEISVDEIVRCWDPKEHAGFKKAVDTIVTRIIRFLFPLRLKGMDNLPENQPFVFILNHLSDIDPIIAYDCLTPRGIWVAKRELFDAPVIGKAVMKMGAIPVDRFSTDITSIKLIMKAISDGRTIAVFPEGTRIEKEQRGVVLPRPGLLALFARLRCPIVPAYIDGSYRLFRPMTITVGKPFELPYRSLKGLTDKEIEEHQKSLMGKIYELGDSEAMARLNGSESENK